MESVKKMNRTKIIGSVLILLLIGLGIKLIPIGIPFAIVGIVIVYLLCFA